MNILQSFSKCKQHQEMESLVKSLSDYGLSPSEWLIKKEKGCIYKIENRNEPSFFFRGVVSIKRGRREWGSISLSGF